MLEAMERARYDITLAGISRSGRWYLVEDPAPLFAAGEVSDDAGLPPVILDYCGGRRLLPVPGAGADTGGAPDAGGGCRPLDVVFPLLHGPCGEDGTVQGLLELAGIACVGAGVAAAAAGMDKQMAKRLFRDQGLPQVAYRVVHGHCWQAAPCAVLDDIEQRLAWPVFVKPANMGSSVGISKAAERTALESALAEAMRFDTKVIVEQAAEQTTEGSRESFREIECAVLGNEEPRASPVGEIIPGREFYDYQTKYVDDKSQLIVPAPLAPQTERRIREYALRAFQAVGCAGLARVDFFLSRDEQTIYLNEINTMPGFTPVSMYPKLWQAGGLPYPRLVDTLVELAVARRGARDRLQTTL